MSNASAPAAFTSDDIAAWLGAHVELFLEGKPKIQTNIGALVVYWAGDTYEYVLNGYSVGRGAAIAYCLSLANLVDGCSGMSFSAR